ncbi:hypothetical protein AB1E18_016636 [Capra hircus]
MYQGGATASMHSHGHLRPHSTHRSQAAPLASESDIPTAGFVQTNYSLEKMDCYKDVKGTIYDYDAFTLNGKEHIQFKQYAGKHVLFVNVATYCGLTAQYPELNALQEELKPFGLVVLGFPCNQFGKQEPGENSEILPGLKYVRPGGGYVPNFQLFEKGDVNGETEQKVFTFLKVSVLTLAPQILLNVQLIHPATCGRTHSWSLRTHRKTALLSGGIHENQEPAA